MKSSTSQIVLSAETISTSKFIQQIVQSIVVHQILPCTNPDLVLLASIALMPKKKEIPKTKKSGNEIDPFDGLERPAVKNMIDMMMWHYRMLPKQLPTFLHEYRVIHFVGAEKKTMLIFLCMNCIIAYWSPIPIGILFQLAIVKVRQLQFGKRSNRLPSAPSRFYNVRTPC
jgi:hypothetical protein